MSDLNALIAQAEKLLTRLETVLPQPLTEPDWQAAIAFRYQSATAAGVVRRAY